MDPQIANFLRTLNGFPVAEFDAFVNETTMGSDGYTVQVPDAPNYGALIERERHGNTGSVAAGATQANIIRAMEEDYQRRFAPVEDILAREVMGGAGLEDDLQRTRESFTSAMENVEGQRQRALAGYGLRGASGVTRDANANVGAMVGALRDTRMRAKDRRREAMVGGVNVSATQKNQLGGGS